MTAETLRALHEEYRRAIEVVRDEAASEETRDNAKAAVSDLRHKLDEALIQDKEDREQAELAAAVEARERVQKILANIEQPEAREPDIRFADVMKDITETKKRNGGEKVTRSFEVHLPRNLEARTEYDVSTAASNAYGSRLIPQTWSNTIAAAMVAQSGVLQAGPTIIRTAGGGQMNFPTLSTDIAAAGITEGSAATQDTPVFGTVALNAYGEGGYLIITEDLINDAGPDVDSYLANLAGRAIAQRVAAFLGDEDIGTGSTAPHAITTDATVGKTAASQTAVTMDELVELYTSVIPPYRVNGKWIVNNAVYTSILSAKSGDGNYIFNPAMSAGAPDTLMGKPLIEDQYFDASTTGNHPAGFGDVGAAFMVRYVGPVQIDFSADAGFTSFEVYLRYKIRFDYNTLIASAWKTMLLA
jgi:HK97 family phage major capsid protein